MSRSGYIDALEPLSLGQWRGQVMSAIRGSRGQKFLGELARAMDAMPEKRLIATELIDADGECCAMGVVFKARGIDVSYIDPKFPEEVGDAIGIAHQMAQEIAYENDECGIGDETPEERWKRMRKWVNAHLKSEDIQ